MREIGKGGRGADENIDELLATLTDDPVDVDTDAAPEAEVADEGIVPCILSSEIEVPALDVRAVEMGEAVEAAAPVATPARYGRAEYRFPACDTAVVDRLPLLSAKSHGELLEILKRLLTGRDLATGMMLPYASIRPFVVAISLILNERQVSPPRFRPKRKAGRNSIGIKWDDDSSMLSNDRQVLDLHWLACSGSDLQASGKWNGLFSSGGLNFDLASEFVATVGNAATKIDILGLHQGEMRQLAVLQTTEMQKRWGDLEAQADSLARPRLREWRAKEKGRSTASIEELLLQYLVIGLVKDSPTEAARLVSLVTGSKVSATTMSRRLELFQRLKLLRRASS